MTALASKSLHLQVKASKSKSFKYSITIFTYRLSSEGTFVSGNKSGGDHGANRPMLPGGKGK